MQISEVTYTQEIILEISSAGGDVDLVFIPEPPEYGLCLAMDADWSDGVGQGERGDLNACFSGLVPEVLAEFSDVLNPFVESNLLDTVEFFIEFEKDPHCRGKRSLSSFLVLDVASETEIVGSRLVLQYPALIGLVVEDNCRDTGGESHCLLAAKDDRIDFISVHI